MKILLRCVKSFNIIKWLNKKIPSLLDDSEDLVRRCQKKSIRNNGKIHQNAFYFGYNKISVDRSKYRHYKKTIQGIPKNQTIGDWRLIKGIVKCIRPIKGVEKIKADPKENNQAHALIICDSRKEKRNEVAKSLSEVFEEIPAEKYM